MELIIKYYVKIEFENFIIKSWIEKQISLILMQLENKSSRMSLKWIINLKN